jgi:hypothetical protein
MRKLCLSVCLVAGVTAGALSAQAPEDISRPRPADAAGFKRQETPPTGSFVIAPGTRILLNMINSLSTKTAAVGDRIYLETAFPVLSGGKIVIPQGS